MDIRNWGQTFVARIKQLPSQAGQLAHNLPESLGNLPDKAQAALQNLPQSVEDGAKAMLANEQVAEGWKLVGQGVGELVGYKPGDHVEISPGAKDPAGNILKDPATKVPKGKPATPKDPIGNAIKDASTTARPKKPPVNVEPPVAPIKKPAIVPGENPLPNIIKDAGNETPLTRTVRRARTPKTTTRVATGVVRNKPPFAPAVTPKAPQALKNGAKVPVKVKNLKGAGEFTDVSKRLTARAELLTKTGHPEEAKTLSDMASRMKRARELYQEGNTPAAFRMVHAKNKIGLANPQVQDALRLGNKAEEVAAAFGKQTTVAKPFAEASEKMLARAKQLSQMGRPTEARQLTTFAKRLSKAGEEYAAGNKDAAMQLFRRGMSGKTQEALRVSNEAQEVFAAFGKKGATTAKAAKASKGATAAAQSGTVATTVTRSAKASKIVKATGRTATSSARVAKGVKATKAATEVAGKAAKVSKSVKAGGEVVQVAEKAAEVTTKVAKAGKGAVEVAKAAEAGGGAASGVMNGAQGIMGKATGALSKVGDSIKGFFGKIGKGASNSAGWQTIKQGFAKMLPGLGKAFKSSAIFSAVFSVAENLFLMLKGERTWRKALGSVMGDTLGGAIGGVVSALASGAAIAGLGALGVVGLPLTLAAGAIGILGYMAFDRVFRNTGIYDTLTHLFT